MQQSAHGEEFEVLSDLENTATIAEERLSAADAELRMYDGNSCTADRTRNQKILTERFNYLIWAFDQAINRLNGELKFVKVPAESQSALKMRDDLRTAKENWTLSWHHSDKTAWFPSSKLP